MSMHEVARDFDEISKVYDETREPVAVDVLRRFREILDERGVRSLLEVGVGTGRVARPLERAGLEVAGVDASPGMLGRARSNGVDRLARATAYRLPFRDRSFDAALFVHVLHILERPGAALRESGRVARLGSMGLFHRRPASEGDAPPAPEEPRRLVRDYLVQAGYPLPERAVGGPWRREAALLKSAPPDR